MTSYLRVFTTIFLCLFLVAYQAQRGSGQWSGKGGPKGGNKASTKLKGKVTDAATGEALEFATISIVGAKRNKLVGGGVSDEKGNFLVEFRGKSIIVKVEFISYDSYTSEIIAIDTDKLVHNIGEIKLSPQGIELDGVEIRADKSETQFSLDKKIFNVGKDLANRGGSAEDILDNVPSVTVDIEGAVSLRGSEGVRILIDGKPSSLAGVGNSNGLRNIPANMIERVEVITNPSARYEAEGMAGIINIVLKKDQGHGFNGAFDVTVGYPNLYGLSANLNYRKGKLNWFANYGIRYRENPGGGYSYQERTVNNDLFILDQDRDINRSSLSNSLRLGADYFLSEKEQLTGSFVYRIGDEDNLGTIIYDDYLNTFDDSGYIGRTVRTDDEFEDELNQEFSLNYTRNFTSKEHKLNASVQFRERAEKESSDLQETFHMVGEPAEPSIKQYSANDEGYDTWLFQLDYIHPLGKDHKWESGLRSSLRSVRNDFFVGDIIGSDTIGIPGLVNDFFYKEDIHAAYFIYGNNFSKFSYQLGLRSEYAQIETQLPSAGEEGMNTRDFFQLFPSGHLNYKIDDSNSWQISYSRRVRRPRFWDLNPFFTFSDSRNFFSGNPLVNPQYTNSYEISNIKIWEKFNLTGSLFYRTTQSSIQRLLIVEKDNGSTLRVPLNVGEIYDLGLDVNTSYRGLKWLRLDGNFSIFRNQLKVNDSEVQETIFDYYKIVRAYGGDFAQFQNEYDSSLEDSETLTWNGRITARISVWDSDFQIRGNYRGPRVSAQGTWDAVGSMNLGWSKDFLKKKLTLTLSVRDVFNSRKRRGTTEINNFYQYSEFQWRSRQASLTASYRINQKKRRGGGRPSGGEFEGGEF